MSVMLIIPIIGLGIGLLLGLLVIKNRGTADQSSRSNRSALQILDERYARGEIDEAEYIRKKTVLKR